MLFRLIFRSSTFESESVLHRLSARSSECTLWYQQLCLRENMFLPYECRRTHPELQFIFKWVAHWADRRSCAESINSLTNKCIDKLISTRGMSLELFALYAGENITALKQKEVHWNTSIKPAFLLSTTLYEYKLFHGTVSVSGGGRACY